MSELSVKHLLGIKYLNEADIQLIFETADHFKEVINRSIKKVPSLRDITIANIFFENSTRTKLSFELAEKRLSADIINFSAAQSSVKKGETLIDTVNNILSMKVDMVVMRHPNPGAGIFFSKHVKASIVNAGDGAHEHPTQALLDSYSIREKLGEVAGKKWSSSAISCTPVLPCPIFCPEVARCEGKGLRPENPIAKIYGIPGRRGGDRLQKSIELVRCGQHAPHPKRDGWTSATFPLPGNTPNSSGSTKSCWTVWIKISSSCTLARSTGGWRLPAM